MWKYYGQRPPAFAEQPGEGCESVWDYPRPPVLLAAAIVLTVILKLFVNKGIYYA